jgi:ABC-type multidrug transport system ATPase subunit
MRDVSKLLAISSSAAAAVERIEEVLNQAPEVLESGVPYQGPTKLRGEITFDNVVFGYASGIPVLKGINLHIPQGKKIALVGLSGGGKTTLVKLIPRFYQTQQGSVRIDGVDNRMYPLDVLRQNVSMVLQDSVLFEGTIRENISLGKPGAGDYEVIEAAKKANIHEMILRDLGGYDGIVREQGKNLSGGQRQRIAIARAILRDAPILILDEPTAALDVESEVEVMHALNNLIVGRTVIMISHRLSTLGNVEEIVVLKEGRIAEQGTFKDLKRRGGVFAALLEEQNRYNLEKASEQSLLLERAAAQSIVRSAYTPQGFNERHQMQPFPYKPGSPVSSPPAIGQSWPAPIGVSPQNIPPAFDNRRQDGNRRQGLQPARNNNIHPVAVPPINARIFIELDGKVVGEYPLNKPVMTVGRLSGNDVQVPSQRVSRLHAKIRWENGRWFIEDADSLNGLIYRGSRVDRLALNNGDLVYIAPTAILRYITK